MSTTRLEKERHRRGLTIEEIGVLAGVPAADVSRLEHRRMRMPKGYSQRLGTVLGIGPDELLQDAGDVSEG